MKALKTATYVAPEGRGVRKTEAEAFLYRTAVV